MRIHSRLRTYENADQFVLCVQVHAAGVEPVQVRLLTAGSSQAAAAAGMHTLLSGIAKAAAALRQQQQQGA
jgi:hypothetical protein